jgi:fructan beta-fructosidase
MPYTQGIAYSNDRGRTWSKYDGNPVLPHVAGTNRDPKVIWHAPGKKWVMALYLDRVDYANRAPDADVGKMTEQGSAISSFALFTSPDLKHWEKTDEFSIEGEIECPEFFEIALDGNPQNTRWVAYGGFGIYVVGSFDGKRFKVESQPQRMQQGNNWFASQTFNDIPASDGRRILIPWANYAGENLYEGMPFSQMMGIPVELKLRTTETGPRLLAYPVKEVSSLRARSHPIKPQALGSDVNPLQGIKGELFDIEAEIAPGDASEISFKLRAATVTYNVKTQELSCADKSAPLKMRDGKIRLRMLVDRTSLEIFGNEGLLYMSMGVFSPPENTSLALSAQGGAARIDSLEVFELQSIWR